MDIVTGKITKRAKSNVDITTVVGSTSRLTIGEASGDSQSNLKVTELPASIDIAQLARELDRLADEAHKTSAMGQFSSETAAIESARKAAHAGDRTRVGEYLQKAGSWALDVATKVGVPVATEALKNLLK